MGVSSPLVRLPLVANVVLAAALCAVASASYPRRPDTLHAGQALKQGEILESSNGVYFVSMQGDGNLVLYRRGGHRAHPVAIWASNTHGKCCGGFVLRMQTDNNLVIYSEKRARPGAVWASNTVCDKKHAKAVVQSDGNFVIYSGRGKAIWSSGTAGGHKSRKWGKGRSKC